MTTKQKVIQSVGMALVMSLSISLAMVLKVHGFHPQWLRMWLSDALFSFLVSLPLSFLVPSLIQKIIVKYRIR